MSFVYSVASTGVYCRPSCPARRPLRVNVAFHETPLAAELAGFRACKRCRPHEAAPQLERDALGPVLEMCRLLERGASAPSLRELASAVGLSESHAHRRFVAATGLTPRRYRDALLRARLREQLRSKGTITQAIYALGFGAPSRFYERAARLLGMQPREYRAGARALTIRFAVGECSLGAILVAATERGVCAVFIGDDPERLLRELEAEFSNAELIGADAGFEGLVARVVGAIDAGSPLERGALPLDLRGTVFQERVWSALTRIPRGKTLSYAQLAAAVGAPKASRAVAKACADNRVAVLIPCHRVVRSDGALAGYRWGIEKKRELLEREQVPLSAGARAAPRRPSAAGGERRARRRQRVIARSS